MLSLQMLSCRAQQQQGQIEKQSGPSDSGGHEDDNEAEWHPMIAVRCRHAWHEGNIRSYFYERPWQQTYVQIANLLSCENNPADALTLKQPLSTC